TRSAPRRSPAWMPSLRATMAESTRSSPSKNKESTVAPGGPTASGGGASRVVPGMTGAAGVTCGVRDAGLAARATDGPVRAAASASDSRMSRAAAPERSGRGDAAESGAGWNGFVLKHDLLALGHCLNSRSFLDRSAQDLVGEGIFQQLLNDAPE